MDTESAVLEFMQKHDQARSEEPRVLTGHLPSGYLFNIANMIEEFIQKVEQQPEYKNVQALRLRLILEETKEFIDASTNGNLVEIADALADLVYVTVGTAIAYGIPFNEVFREVHRSNMTKPALDENDKGGKVGKEGYEPPDIEGAIYRGRARRRRPVRRGADEAAAEGSIHSPELGGSGVQDVRDEADERLRSDG